MKVIDNVIVALDNLSESEVLTFMDKTDKSFKTIKVGMELFYKSGPDFLTKLKNDYDVEIFLILKLHDIPNTVSKAIKSLEGLPIKFLTIHLSGGKKMVEAALAAQEKYIPACKLLGVTYLTSLDQEDIMKMWGLDFNTGFEKLLSVALETNIHGVVSSPNEVTVISQLEKAFKKNLIKVTPGIRFKDEIESGNTGDQKRVMSPHDAINSGSNYLVMGRSLNQAKDLNSRIKELSN